MNFRTDINGLRAIAVLGVVFFHFLGNALPGGFAGVDVFFVISGFLMTSIIFRGMEQNNFKLVDFYRARAKRIVPALAVLCVVLMVVGWFVLHPLDFGAMGKHILGSLSFTSNFVYLMESGYFDEASREKWLLHTWSLSVEWQFYILYPIVLVLLKKVLQLHQLRYVLMLGTVISLAACLYASGRWPIYTFYLLPTRAWEMLAGGLAFLYPFTLTSSVKRAAEAAGVLLTTVAYLMLSEVTVWPGYLTVIPVLGSVLIITAHREHSWLTGNRIFQWIGTNSYSIYLWHWPLVVGLNYVGKSGDMYWVTAAMVLSFTLGALSYQWVERRKMFAFTGKLFSVIVGPNLGWLFVATAVLSFWVLYQDGFASRLSPEYLALTDKHVMPRRENGYCFLDFNNGALASASENKVPCVLGDRRKSPTVLLFGDSFAGHYEPFWDVLGTKNGVAVQAVTTNWCNPLAGDAFDGPQKHPAFQQCLLNRKFLWAEMAKYDVLVFAGMWSNGLTEGHLNQVKSAIQQASQKVATVVVMPPPMHYDTNVLKRFHRSLFYKQPFDLGQYSTGRDVLDQQAYALLQQYAKNLSNVIFIERSQLFSESDTYNKQGMKMPYSLDGMHITVEGSIEAAHAFARSELYTKILQRRLVRP